MLKLENWMFCKNYVIFDLELRLITIVLGGYLSITMDYSKRNLIITSISNSSSFKYEFQRNSTRFVYSQWSYSFPAYIFSNMCQHCNTIMSVNVSLIYHTYLKHSFQTQEENESTMCLLCEFTEFIALKCCKKLWTYVCTWVNEASCIISY